MSVPPLLFGRGVVQEVPEVVIRDPVMKLNCAQDRISRGFQFTVQLPCAYHCIQGQ